MYDVEVRLAEMRRTIVCCFLGPRKTISVKDPGLQAGRCRRRPSSWVSATTTSADVLPSAVMFADFC